MQGGPASFPCPKPFIGVSEPLKHAQMETPECILGPVDHGGGPYYTFQIEDGSRFVVLITGSVAGSPGLADGIWADVPEAEQRRRAAEFLVECLSEERLPRGLSIDGHPTYRLDSAVAEKWA